MLIDGCRDDPTPTTADPNLALRAVRLEALTIAWNSLEAVLAVGAGILARSVALSGFGGDSVIEVFAAAVVMFRLCAAVRGKRPDEARERRALRVIASTFFLLCGWPARLDRPFSPCARFSALPPCGTSSSKIY